MYWVDQDTTPEDDARFVTSIMNSANAQTLILDSYVVDQEYQLILRESDVEWMQFDSHARQALWADWVLHASPGATPEVYEPLRANRATRLLLGPRYAVLGKPFQSMSESAHARDEVRRILLCLGGGDDYGATLRVLRWLSPLAADWDALDVIIGSANPSRNEIRNTLSQWPSNGIAQLHVDTDQVARLMSSADLGIVSGGTVSYESCAAGLPMLLIRMADNQTMNVEGWAREGAGLSLGDVRMLTEDRVLDAYRTVSSQPQRLQAMSAAGRALVDGCGAARVARELLDKETT